MRRTPVTRFSPAPALRFPRSCARLPSPAATTARARLRSRTSSETDGAFDATLDVGERWVFTGAPTLTAADEGTTSTTNTGVGHGTDVTGADITAPTYPSETDFATVTVTNN